MSRNVGFAGRLHVSRPLKNVQFCSSTRKAIISTTGIHSVFRGLEFSPDAVIGQKEMLCKGLVSAFRVWIAVSAAVIISPDEYESIKETSRIISDADLMAEIRQGLNALKAKRAKVYTLEEL